MGYVTENLAPGEQVIHQAKLHWKVFFSPIAKAIAAFIAFSLEREIGEATHIVGTLLLIWAGLQAIVRAIDLQTSEFAVTNRRLIMKWGILRRQSMDLSLMQMETLLVEQGLIGRILDYGRIVVAGSGGTRQYTPDIADPFRYRLSAQSQSGHIPSFDQNLCSTPKDPCQIRECPHCAEPILKKAKVCKHCGREAEPISDIAEQIRYQVSTIHNESTANEKQDPNIIPPWAGGMSSGVIKPTQQSAPPPANVSEEAFFAILQFEGIEKARSLYHQLSPRASGPLVFQESRLNKFAYEELNKGNSDLAIDLFKLSTEVFPNSANSYANLADAYKGKGNPEQAISYYKKALEVLISDQSNTEQFRQSLFAKIKGNLTHLIGHSADLICSTCHMENEKGSKYCIFCGTSLQPSSAEPIKEGL